MTADRAGAAAEAAAAELTRLGAEYFEVVHRADPFTATQKGVVLGTAEFPEIAARLRDDPALRFTSSAQIVDVVTDALGRAEAARAGWFPAFDIPGCVIEEIDPVEAGNAPLGYYRPPAAGGLAARRALRAHR